MRKPKPVRRTLSARDYETIRQAIRESERSIALMEAVLDEADARDPLIEEAFVGLLH